MKNACAVMIAVWMVVGGPAAAEEGVVARVNGVAVTDVEVQRALAQKIPYALYHRNVSEDRLAALRNGVIGDLIDDELIYQDAKKSIRISRKEANQEFEKAKKRFNTEKEFLEALGRVGVSEETFRAMLVKDLTVRKMKEREITEKAKASDGEVRAYYERNREKYQEPEKYRIRQIFINVSPNANRAQKEAIKKRALALLDRVKAGEDFARLAWDHSEDDYRYKSGDIGYVHKGMLDEGIQKVIDTLRPGDTSGLVESLYGYFIIRLEDKTAPRQLPFDEVKDRLKKEAEQKKRETLEADYLTRLRAAAKIIRYDGAAKKQ